MPTPVRASRDDPDELLARACAGDPAALQAVLLGMHGHLRRVVADALGARYRRYIDPEDVLQEAYIALFGGGLPAGAVSPEGFRRWVERVVLNKLRDAQRALRRRRRDVGRNQCAAARGPSTHDGLLQRLTGGGTTPSGALAREEARAMLQIAMARLSEVQREVLRLRVTEGLPLPEVARRIGRSESAVWGLWTRALKGLRESWGPMSDWQTRADGPAA